MKIEDAKFKVYVDSNNMYGAIANYTDFCKEHNLPLYSSICDLSGSQPCFCFGFDDENIAVLFKLSQS